MIKDLGPRIYSYESIYENQNQHMQISYNYNNMLNSARCCVKITHLYSASYLKSERIKIHQVMVIMKVT